MKGHPRERPRFEARECAPSAWVVTDHEQGGWFECEGRAHALETAELLELGRLARDARRSAGGMRRASLA
jgi:hypothetical protein